MIGVHQTKLGAPDGDCFEACIASLLEVQISAVPYFGDDTAWWDACQEWLAAWGLTYIEYAVEVCGEWRPEGYWIGAIDVGPHHHSVVYHDRELVWQPDPHWSAARTVAKRYPLTRVGYLAVLDVGVLARRLREPGRRAAA